MPPLRSSISIFHPIHKPNLAPSGQTCRHHHLRTHQHHHHSAAIRKRPRPTATTSQSPHPNSITHLIKFTASFTSTASRPAKEQNHYETLSLPVTATADEIKKKFYALSLKHHPDRNRSDPSSSQRFARLSAAYNVLGNTSKRQSYDRDHGFHHTQHAHRHPTTPAGSHSSHSAHAHHSSGGSYAGSRPASGLSKRRGTFTGPPPSFYANGGYGRTGRTASEGGFEGAFGFGGSGGAGGAGGGAGSGNEWADFTAEHKRGREVDPEDPFDFIRRNPLRHFNARAHYRTQRAEDMRRGERRRSEVYHTIIKEREEAAAGTAGSGTASASGPGPGYGLDIASLVGFTGIVFGVICLTEYVRGGSAGGGSRKDSDSKE